ncbi:hypothetical protein O181_060556 [Austropuccinia psidii MF-1]|uniref:Uncharacterized protein n=1 Tax=Austropuccinia psidii MF-1 TaxID=1389203 RepID=A0A9Q3HWQ9_9BASI|nr:hypothetical protein [Austropuccinia psidii MF-1]
MSSSILLEHFNESAKCQAASISIGQSFFTAPPPPLKIADEIPESKPKDLGAFGWVIQDFGPEEPFSDTPAMKETYYFLWQVTRILLEFQFSADIYKYTVRVRCIIRSGAQREKYVSLASVYTLTEHMFTEKTQAPLHPQVFRLITAYQKLNFPANSLPGEMFPPSYALANNSLAKVPITHKDILGWITWLDGFSYVPTKEYIPQVDLMNEKMDSKFIYNPQGDFYPTPNASAPENYREAFTRLIADPSGVSSSKLTVSGMSALHPIPTNWTTDQVFTTLPSILRLYIGLFQSLLGLIMDLAANDIDGRILGAKYLCTPVERPLKKFIPMMSMLVGNCAGTFTSILAILIVLARKYDIARNPKPEQSENGADLNSNKSISTKEESLEEGFLSLSKNS